MERRPYLSIIIPVFNDPQNLSTLLESISHNSFKDFELIVVNDGSSDQEVEKIANISLVTYCKHLKNRGVAAARNTGAKKAEADILVFFDSDIILNKDTLQRFADGFTNNNRNYFQGLTDKVPAQTGLGAELTALSWNFETINLKEITIYSMCFAIKKDLFFELNGFDESYTGVGSEEFEFAHRLSKKTSLWTDRTLLLKHNFQNVRNRTVSLFKRSIRYTTMFLFTTKTLDTQIGRPLEIVSAACALFSTLFLLFSGCVNILMGGTSALPFLQLGIFLLFVQSMLNLKFLLYLKREKGIAFMIKSLPVLFLWACITGVGIGIALLSAPGILLRKKNPHSQCMSDPNTEDPTTQPQLKKAMD